MAQRYEDVYLKGYANMQELMCGLTRYFVYYNEERPTQSWGYQTPNLSIDKRRGGANDSRQVQQGRKGRNGQRRSAASEECFISLNSIFSVS